MLEQDALKDLLDLPFMLLVSAPEALVQPLEKHIASTVSSNRLDIGIASIRSSGQTTYNHPLLHDWQYLIVKIAGSTDWTQAAGSYPAPGREQEQTKEKTICGDVTMPDKYITTGVTATTYESDKVVFIPTNHDNPLLRAIKDAVHVASGGPVWPNSFETGGSASASPGCAASNARKATIARALEQAGSSCGYLVFYVV